MRLMEQFEVTLLIPTYEDRNAIKCRRCGWHTVETVANSELIQLLHDHVCWGKEKDDA